MILDNRHQIIFDFPAKGSKEADKLLMRYVTENKDDLARELGYASRDSLYHIFNRMYGYTKAEKDKILLSGTTSEISINRKIEKDVILERALSEAKYYKSLYSETIKKIGLQDLIVSTMKEISLSIPEITVETTKKNGYVISDKGSETDVPLISDLHAGEIIDLAQTMGISQYDMTIMNRRLGMLFRKILELVNLRRSSLNIRKLVIPHLGDMLSGDIHPELVRTNVAHMMNLSVRTAFILAQGIAFLSPHFDQIDVPCVVGNHPRLYQAPSYKDKYINWDYMLYQWEASFCKGLKNVKFHIPKSPFYLMDVENTRILMMHGDSIKSWMGVPWYGIERAVLRLRELLQGSNEHFDSVLLGHFHSRADLDHITGPIIINGSVKGGDEFSIGSLQTSNVPSQNLIYYHSSNGYLGGGPIYLSGADDRSELAFSDFLTDTWSELEEEVTKKAKQSRDDKNSIKE